MFSYLQNFFYVVLLCSIFSCKEKIATIELKTSIDSIPIESGKNVEIIYSDSAKIKIKLFAPQMDKYKNAKEYVELPMGVKVTFFDKDGLISSELKSNYAIRQDNEKRMEARKNVVVTNNKGERLNTEHLIWDTEKKIIYTATDVKITTAKEIIYGEGLEAAEDFSKYKIKNIKGTVTLQDI